MAQIAISRQSITYLFYFEPLLRLISSFFLLFEHPMLRNTLFRPYVQLVSKRLDHCRRSEANFGSHTPHRTVRHRHISATPPWLPYLSLHLIPHKIGSQQCTSGSAGGSQGRAGPQRSDLSYSETFHLQHFFSFFLVNCGCKRNHLRCLQFTRLLFCTATSSPVSVALFNLHRVLV